MNNNVNALQSKNPVSNTWIQTANIFNVLKKMSKLIQEEEVSTAPVKLLPPSWRSDILFHRFVRNNAKSTRFCCNAAVRPSIWHDKLLPLFYITSEHHKTANRAIQRVANFHVRLGSSVDKPRRKKNVATAEPCNRRASIKYPGFDDMQRSPFSAMDFASTRNPS